MRSPPRAVIAAHDAIERRRISEGVRRAGVAIVADAGDPGEAIELARFYEPDLVLLDAVVFGREAVVATGRMVRDHPGRLVVLLTGADQEELALAGLRAGAAGILRNDLTVDALARAVAGVLRGEAAVSRTLSMRLIDAIRGSGA